MWNELRYTCKLIGKNIYFSLLCITVLGIGIGMVLPLYSLVDNTAFVNPPLAQGERFVALVKTAVPPRPVGFSKYDIFHYYYFKNAMSSFQTLAAWRDGAVSISDGEYAAAYRRAEIQPELLQKTGVQPLRGRMFSAEDVVPGAQPVAMIGYEVWQNYYAGRDDIVGLASRIDGATRTIVGVMPAGFTFPSTHQLWLPLALPQSGNAGEGKEDLILTGILAAGVSLNAADSEVQLLQAQIKNNWPEQYQHFDTSLVLPFINMASGKPDPVGNLLILVVIVLLVVFNIGNLFVARGEERVVELAVRSALGASPRNIARALMLESLLLCVFGLALGFVLAYFSISYLNGILGNVSSTLTANFWWDMSLNIRIVAGTVVVVGVIWLVSGGLPAWRISRTDLNQLLGSSGKGMSTGSSTRLSKVLVNVQLVFGCVLLTVGLLQTVVMANGKFTTITNGDNLYTGKVVFNETRLANPEARQNYLGDLVQALLAQPGVAKVAFTTLMPGIEEPTVPYNAEDQNLMTNAVYPRAHVVAVSDNFFAMIDVPLIQGRTFGPEDTSTALPVAIVDQRLADLLWPDDSALGKRIQLNPAEASPWLTIVGVTTPKAQEPMLLESMIGVPVIYQPITQANMSQVLVLFSSTIPGVNFREVLRAAATQADRDTPITEMLSVSQQEAAMAEGIGANQRMAYSVVLLAVYLTGAATYGLAARATGRRRLETGIRMALGASRSVSLALFLKDGLKTVVTGLSIGATLSVVGSYLVISNIPVAVDMSEILVPIIASICLVMGSLVMLANYLPARKIVEMEPADALQYE